MVDDIPDLDKQTRWGEVPVTLAVCGGSGFIGRRLLSALPNDPAMRVRLLVHRRDVGTGAVPSSVGLVPGDLMQRDSLDTLVAGASLLINLAYMPDASRDAQLSAAANLAQACATAGVRRLVHLSTAAVVGHAPDDVVTESTRVEPRTAYERTKLEIEQILIERAASAFELIILRPTAVFGPEGRNLVKLATSLSHDSAAENYVRACIHGRRKMNLVCVDNVVAAIVFAMKVGMASGSETFIVSDDDDSANNYRDVESMLRRALGCGEYAFAPAAVPSRVLRTLLRWSGRSNSNPNRVYSGAKIAAAGFHKVVSLDAGLALFGDWFRQAHAKAVDAIG